MLVRNKMIYPFSILSAVSPSVAQAQWLTLFANSLYGILTVAVPVLIGAALAVFIWGVVAFITNSGDEKAREDAKKRILWGLIILFVIISVWGLVRLLQVMLGVPITFSRAPFVRYEY